MLVQARRRGTDQRGFTFLELLLVLSIVMILTTVILPFSEKRLHRVTEEDALNQFIATVHEMQLYALTHREHVSLGFKNNGEQYFVTNETGEVIIAREFPEGMRNTKNSPFNRLEFTGTGYMVKTGRMSFFTKSKGVLFITFQFERGRTIVKE